MTKIESKFLYELCLIKNLTHVRLRAAATGGIQPQLNALFNYIPNKEQWCLESIMNTVTTNKIIANNSITTFIHSKVSLSGGCNEVVLKHIS